MKKHYYLVTQLYQFFSQEVYGILPRNKLHILCEFANFIIGGQKLFDLNKNNFNKKEWKLIVEFLEKIIPINNTFILIIEDENVYLTRKKNQKDIKHFLEISYMKLPEVGMEYGNFMGFPVSATKAWFDDYSNSIENRKYLLNFYANQVIESVLGHIFLMPFVFSIKSWQNEYKYQIRRHLKIYKKFPEIFIVEFLNNNKKNVNYQTIESNLKSHLKKKDLFKIFSPYQKAVFIACKGNELTMQEKCELFFIFETS